MAAHIAKEATGVYWKPIWNIPGDGDFELILATAARVKNVSMYLFASVRPGTS
jgi:transposase